MPVAAWPYEKAGWPLTSSNVPANDPAWLEILQKIKPSLIHFHHLLNHPLSLLTKLSGTGIPIIVSIHDYYFLCQAFILVTPASHSNSRGPRSIKPYGGISLAEACERQQLLSRPATRLRILCATYIPI
jgi:hypothetical protein